MANEFIVRNGLIVQNGTTIISGSLTVVGGITGSLSGNIETATSASYALTASYALNGGGTFDTSSLLTTASVSLNTITFTKGDGSTFPITVNTGSATGGPGGSAFPYTGSAEITGSLVVVGSVTATSFSGDGSGLTGIAATSPSTNLFNYYNFI